jgi:uncharacterized CHY-type Zn-finger protein
MGEERKKIVCADCGRNLEPEEEGRTWARCSHCRKPVCFECSHYRAMYKKSQYLGNYVEAIRLCKKCYGTPP